MLLVSRLFMDVDNECSSQISEVQFYNYLKKYYDKDNAFKYNTKIFKNIDVNNSKTIEYGEFRVCGMEINFDFIMNKLQGMFNLMDNDQNN